MFSQIGIRTIALGLALQMIPSVGHAQQADFARSVALENLIYADAEDVFQTLSTFLPDLRNIPTDPVPERLIGDQFFHFFLVGETPTHALRCIRIGKDSQAALIRELGHPLRAYFMDHVSTEMKDVGDHDVIMDCYVNFAQGAFNVPLAIDYFTRKGYVMDIRATPERDGLSADANEPYSVLFETAEDARTTPSIVRGRIEANGSVLMLWFRFVPREKIIS